MRKMVVKINGISKVTDKLPKGVTKHVELAYNYGYLTKKGKRVGTYQYLE